VEEDLDTQDDKRVAARTRPQSADPLPAVIRGLDHRGMDNTQAQPPVVRRAAAADVAALTRLREVMLSDMGMLTAGADPGCRDKAEAWFAQRPDDDASPHPIRNDG